MDDKKEDPHMGILLHVLIQETEIESGFFELWPVVGVVTLVFIRISDGRPALKGGKLARNVVSLSALSCYWSSKKGTET